MPGMPPADFNLQKREEIALTIVLGKRRSGKTTLVKRLVATGAPMECVRFDRTNFDRIGDFVRERYAAIERDRDAHAARCGHIDEWRISHHLRRRVVLDDFPSSRVHAALEELAVNHRHLALDIVVVAQNFSSMHPSIRENADYLTTTSRPGARAIARIYDQYMTGGATYSVADFSDAVGPGTWVDNTTWDPAARVCRIVEHGMLRAAL
jgi:hypothetical protein